MRVMRIGLFLLYVMGRAGASAHNVHAPESTPRRPFIAMKSAAPVQVF